MKIASNQEIEQYYFEMFRKDYPLPHGTVIYDDKPDVILDGDKKIGIEITNFFLEKGNLTKSEQIQRKLREKVIKSAQHNYQKMGGKKIELSIGFDKKNPIRDQNKLVQKLISRKEN
jgi:hypothetical protein